MRRENGSAWIWLLVLVVVIGGITLHYNFSRTCTEEKIPFDTTTEQTDTLYPSQSYTRVAGVEGVMEVCHNIHKEFVNQKVIKQPISQVKVEGKKVDPPSEIFAPRYIQPSGGAICNDGWNSPSTGRGTCSHHGGVDYYL